MTYRRYSWQRDSNREAMRKAREGKLKKHYIIRESDLNRIPASTKKNYDISFKPLTQEYFARRTTWFYLKDKKYLGDQYALYEYPASMLKRITNIPLWNSEYPNWLVKYDEDGVLVIRAGLRQPESKLGLVRFKPKEMEK